MYLELKENIPAIYNNTAVEFASGKLSEVIEYRNRM